MPGFISSLQKQASLATTLITEITDCVRQGCAIAKKGPSLIPSLARGYVAAVDGAVTVVGAAASCTKSATKTASSCVQNGIVRSMGDFALITYGLSHFQSAIKTLKKDGDFATRLKKAGGKTLDGCCRLTTLGALSTAFFTGSVSNLLGLTAEDHSLHQKIQTFAATSTSMMQSIFSAGWELAKCAVPVGAQISAHIVRHPRLYARSSLLVIPIYLTCLGITNITEQSSYVDKCLGFCQFMLGASLTTIVFCYPFAITETP